MHKIRKFYIKKQPALWVIIAGCELNIKMKN